MLVQERNATLRFVAVESKFVAVKPVPSAMRAVARSVRRGPSYGRVFAARCATLDSRRFVGDAVKFSLHVLVQDRSINAKKKHIIIMIFFLI